MIAIVRIKGEPPGVCRYRLLMNREPLAEFDHLYADGLSVCLQRAAEAWQFAKAAKVAELERSINTWCEMRNEL